jgi:hypothetical protein
LIVIKTRNVTTLLCSPLPMNELLPRTYGDVCKAGVVIICPPHLLYQTCTDLGMWTHQWYYRTARKKIQWMYKRCVRHFVCISLLYFCDSKGFLSEWIRFYFILRQTMVKVVHEHLLNHCFIAIEDEETDRWDQKQLFLSGECDYKKDGTHIVKSVQFFTSKWCNEGNTKH